jgi:hypothetical protein
MRAHPATTYVRAGPKTWGRIREAAGEQPVVEAFRIPLALHPRTLARQSLARPAHALREGRALDAQRMAHAAEAVLRVEAWVDWWPEDGEEIDDDGREALLVQFVRSIAVDVAVKLARGQPLPAAYADLAAEYADAMAEPPPPSQSG